MTATNTPVDASVEAPVENKGLMSKMVEGAKGLISDVKGAAGAVMVTAVAVTGAATENAEAATVAIGLGSGLSHSTISLPQKVPGGLADETNSVLYNSELLYATPQSGSNILTNTTIDRFTFNLSPTDFGSGGNLTITFRLNAGTSSTTTADDGKGIASTEYRVLQELRFGLQGGSSSVIGSLDSTVKTNDIYGPFGTFGEAWRADSGIKSYTMPITQAGIFNLDNALFTQNATGIGALGSTTISFTPTIPEPSAPLLVGIAGTLGLLRRKRNETESTNTSAS